MTYSYTYVLSSGFDHRTISISFDDGASFSWLNTRAKSSTGISPLKRFDVIDLIHLRGISDPRVFEYTGWTKLYRQKMYESITKCSSCWKRRWKLSVLPFKRRFRDGGRHCEALDKIPLRALNILHIEPYLAGEIVFKWLPVMNICKLI